MKSSTAVVEKRADTGLDAGYVPGFAGAHSQDDCLDELIRNWERVVGMLLEDGESPLQTEFVETLRIQVVDPMGKRFRTTPAGTLPPSCRGGSLARSE